jgi:hypothetical protein
MDDDWRLRINLREEGIAGALAERIEGTEVESELRHTFQDRVVVSRDGPEVFLYAGSREAAEAAENDIRELAAKHRWDGLQFELRRWHPDAESWEEPSDRLPESESEHEAEREQLIERERREAQERGYPEFEVRVDCPSHRDAVAFAEKLRAEGLQSVHRFRYVLVGALDEDAAKALAERITEEAPAGSEVKAEGTWRAMWSEAPRNRYAAIFGGLAG